MECADLAERLTDFMEGELEEEVEAAALDHLATCSACETVLAETRDVVGLARIHGKVTLSEDSRAQLWSRVVGETDSTT